MTWNKLADADQRVIWCLILIGLELFLMHLLEEGWFHADPHPGNLYVTDVDGGGGQLCLLDFGLCARVDKRDRRAMTALFNKGLNNESADNRAVVASQDSSS